MSKKVVTTETVEKAYRSYAKYYDFIFGKVFHPGRSTAIEHLHCRPGERILEVGVGTGLSLELYPDYTRVVGIDLSEPMLKQARAKVKDENLTSVEDLLIMDAQNMSFADNSFDLVWSLESGEHMPDKQQFVNELLRVATPGGRIIIVTW